MLAVTPNKLVIANVGDSRCLMGKPPVTYSSTCIAPQGSVWHCTTASLKARAATLQLSSDGKLACIPLNTLLQGLQL
jgi:hypothetical protein